MIQRRLSKFNKKMCYPLDLGSRSFRTNSILKLAHVGSSSLKFEPEVLATQPKNGDCYDLIIVGGGIIGCATAMGLKQRFPSMKMALVEKEAYLAMHQSGRNSGVIHAGIYYKPGSLKAKLCVEGMRLSYDYFSKHNIPYKKCGKLIVALSPDEISRLKDLFDRGNQNNVPNLQLLDYAGIKKHEPLCQGKMAIWSPETGIVDFAQVCRSYAFNFISAGGKLHTSFEVKRITTATENLDYSILLFNSKGKHLRSKYLLTCGGLQADRLAQMSGGSKIPRIIPFRGEYLVLNPNKRHLVHTNIYPVPDPRFPFLGVHLTPRMNGEVWIGPNAVLALKREGYGWNEVNLKDILESISYPGFQKLAIKYAFFGLGEIIRSALPNVRLEALQQYIPDFGPHDVKKGPSGVRAQALDPQGNLVDDFVFDQGHGELQGRVLHVRNAPSPGATSSLAIAKMIVEKMQTQFSL